MYRAIMRNDFAAASLHADTALAADDQLALAYLAKMIEAAWITSKRRGLPRRLRRCH